MKLINFLYLIFILDKINLKLEFVKERDVDMKMKKRRNYLTIKIICK